MMRKKLSRGDIDSEEEPIEWYWWEESERVAFEKEEVKIIFEVDKIYGIELGFMSKWWIPFYGINL